jgi:hypothetical protein
MLVGMCKIWVSVKYGHCVHSAICDVSDYVISVNYGHCMHFAICDVSDYVIFVPSVRLCDCNMFNTMCLV